MDVDAPGSVLGVPNRRSTRTSNQSSANALAKGLEASGDKGEKGKKRGRGRESQLSEGGDQPVPKKKRVSSDSGPGSTRPPAESTPIPSNAPAWFSKAMGMFNSSNLGPEWACLLEGWAKFEALEAYQGASKLSAGSRPVAVKDWIQRARAPTWRPTIANTLQYASQFDSWWTSLQPEWRVSKDGSVLTDVAEGSWEAVRIGGVNGLLSVVVALFFWGSAAKDEDSRDSGWISAVKDVDRVLERLIATK